LPNRLSYLIYGRPGAARSNDIPVNMDKLKHEDRTITTEFSAEQVLWKNFYQLFKMPVIGKIKTQNIRIVGLCTLNLVLLLIRARE